MLRFALVFSICLLSAMNAQAVFVSGQAYLSGQGNHENIRVIFEAVSPSAETDTTYTNSAGAYAATLEPGVYNVLYFFAGFADYRLPNQVLLWDTTLDPVTLLPPLSGYLSGSLGPGDFQVTDSIVVTTGQSLTIQPGTRLFFDGMHEFRVRGLLTAVGTLEDSILFSRRNTSGMDTAWGGIRFLNSPNSCRLDYCTVEYGQGSGEFPAEGGGAICSVHSNLRMYYCSFRHNRSEDYGGGLYFYQCSPELHECLIDDNATMIFGGGVYCREAHLLMDGCRMTRNSCSDGAGLMLYNAFATVRRCDFTDNDAYYGSGVYVRYGGNVSIGFTRFNESVTLTRNPVYLSGTDSSEIFQSTIVSRAEGCALICDEAGVLVNSCIVACLGECDYGIDFGAGQQQLVRNSDVYAPQASVYDGVAPAAFGLIALTNPNGDSCDTYYNIFLDPQFVDTANGDYHLQAGSPCIDAGDPALGPDPDGTVADIGAFYFDQMKADDPERTAVRRYELLQNYPNPFNSATQIVFDLPQAARAELIVYDVTGRQVTTLFSGMAAAGRNRVSWTAEDLPSGIYFCRLASGDSRQTRKLILMK
jgi:hypothetical protein